MRRQLWAPALEPAAAPGHVTVRTDPLDTMQKTGTQRLVIAIGAISVSHHDVWTPSGTAPVNHVSWEIHADSPRRADSWRRALPGVWAPQSVELTVTVASQGWQHVEDLGPSTPDEVAGVRAKVTQARMLALRSVVWSLAGSGPHPVARGSGEQVRPAG